MLLLIVIIILISCTSILGNIYFNFFLFQQNYQDLNNYYNSEYGAISSIERGLLSSKYMGQGYEGSGGFLSTGYWGNISDSFSGIFGKFTNNYNGLYFDIDSKTNKIKGQIKYDTTTTIILSLNTGSDYYSGTNTIKNFFDNNNYISGYIKNNFDKIKSNDDIQLKRIMTFKDGYGYIIAQNTGNEVLNSKINEGVSIYFSSGTYDIFNLSSTGSGFKNSGTNYDSIGQALTEGISLLLQFYITGGYLKTNNGIIPYIDLDLESNINFSDIYYYITGASVVGNYKRESSIKKPTSNYKNPNYQNFIFPNYN